MLGFSTDEIMQIAVSMIVVAVAFSIGYLFESPIAFVMMLPIVLIGVGSGFILHELAHKFVSLHYGIYARYRAWDMGLILALGMAIITRGQFVFAAPGAVYIFSRGLSPEKDGLISAAGPITNLLLGLLFLSIALAFPGSILDFIGRSAASVNFFLGAFNMIPIQPLDGSKVYYWNWLAWLALAVPLAAGVILLF